MNNTQDILNMTALLVLSIPTLSIIGLPIMIITGQVLSILRERSAYAKCAKQISNLTLILAYLLCVVGLGILWIRVGGAIFAPQAEPFNWQLLFGYNPSMVSIQADLIIWLTFLAASALMTIVHITWPTWEEKRLVHQSMAIVASFWYGFAAYGIVCVMSAEYAATIGIDYPLSIASLFMPRFESNFWNAGPYLAPLAFALGGGMVSVWLIIRRNYDDFGRDYYATMLKWCASWARAAWFILWFLLVGTTIIQWLGELQNPNYMTSPAFLQSALFLFLWLIPGVLWTLALRSEAPLRHKMTMILAFVMASFIIMPLFVSLQSL